MMLEKLSAPFPPEAIHWRAQQVFERNGAYQALALAYIDARDGMQRLDEVVGPTGWQDYYEETATGRVICKLSILSQDGDWITKSDGAGNTAVEAEKGGISDAFKRAGVKWGIGRYLYDLKNVYAPCEAYDSGRKTKNGKVIWAWKKWKPEAFDIFAKALRDLKPVGAINETTQTWLQNSLSAHNLQPGELLKTLGPQNIREITYEQLPKVQAFINARKAA